MKNWFKCWNCHVLASLMIVGKIGQRCANGIDCFQNSQVLPCWNQLGCVSVIIKKHPWNSPLVFQHPCYHVDSQQVEHSYSTKPQKRSLQNNNWNVKIVKFILANASFCGAFPGLSWRWSFDRAFFLFQLVLNAATTLQTPIAREVFGFFLMVVMIARCKLWKIGKDKNKHRF